MAIDWKKEIDNYKEELLEDLFELLRIDSVRDDDHKSDESPVGPGPRKALEKMLSFGDRDGFVTKNVDNIAGHIEYGAGDELMGLLGHVDVVPVGNGWDNDPFDPQLIDGKIIARGSSDDKGPTMAAYYAIKLIKKLGLPVKKRVRLIVGTDEESEWLCMDRYFKTEEMPDFGFSPDAEFPIINGEKGMVSLYVSVKGEQDKNASNYLNSFDAGIRENMVPQEAHAEVRFVDPEKAEKAFFDFLEHNPVTGTFETLDDGKSEITVLGKASHGSMPEKGVNAGTYLAVFLTQFSFTGQAKGYLALIAEQVHLDFTGKNVGAEHTDEVMGTTSMNAGIMTFTEDTHGLVVLNFRFPRGITVEKIEIAADSALSSYNATIGRGKDKTPHYVSAEDELVKTLLSVYAKQTGFEAHEQSIGGGTYGRILERGVAFGALFPDSEDTMHQVNEFMTVKDLLRAASIYAEAIYELIK